MYPYIDSESFDYRVERLHNENTERRMARTARVNAKFRSGPSFREAVGNGLIALGERMTEPPSVDDASINRAA